MGRLWDNSDEGRARVGRLPDRAGICGLRAMTA